MKINHHLNVLIFRQNRFQIFSCIVVGFASVQLSTFHIKGFPYMKNLIFILLCKNFCQIIPHSQNGVFFHAFSGICKSLLGMAVINKDLRNILIFLQGKIFPEKRSCIQLYRICCRSLIYNKEMIHKIILICQYFRGKIQHRSWFDICGNTGNFFMILFRLLC